MKRIKAPHGYRPFTVFLAGSIEMGSASDWRGELAAMLQDSEVLLLDPWRDDWDESWKQSKDDANFREQVEWELKGIEEADLVVVHFDPGTTAPITLLELGLCARFPSLTVVHCPEGFWRKGNIDVVCAYHGMDQVDTLEALADYIRDEARVP